MSNHKFYGNLTQQYAPRLSALLATLQFRSGHYRHWMVSLGHHFTLSLKLTTSHCTPSTG